MVTCGYQSEGIGGHGFTAHHRTQNTPENSYRTIPHNRTDAHTISCASLHADAIKHLLALEKARIRAGMNEQPCATKGNVKTPELQVQVLPCAPKLFPTKLLRFSSAPRNFPRLRAGIHAGVGWRDRSSRLLFASPDLPVPAPSSAPRKKGDSSESPLKQQLICVDQPGDPGSFGGSTATGGSA